MTSKDSRFKSLGHDPRFSKPKNPRKLVKRDERFHNLTTEEFTTISAKDIYGRSNTKEKSYDSEAQTSIAIDNGSDSTTSDINNAELPPNEISYEDNSHLIADQNDRLEPTCSSFTDKLAVVNLDWEHLNADDLFHLFCSAIPSEMIKTVKIYESEYGKAKMTAEELAGPIREDLQITDENSIARQYQLDKLRYYYAVAVFADDNCARQVYEECNGVEFESSGNLLDLRVVPSDMDFTEDFISECHELKQKYKPAEFQTDALQHSKVKVTWDADDLTRASKMKSLMNGENAEDIDIDEYFGSDSEGEYTSSKGLQNCREILLNNEEETKAPFLKKAVDLKEGNSYEKHRLCKEFNTIESQFETITKVENKLAVKTIKEPFSDPFLVTASAHKIQNIHQTVPTISSHSKPNTAEQKQMNFGLFSDNNMPKAKKNMKDHKSRVKKVSRKDRTSNFDARFSKVLSDKDYIIDRTHAHYKAE